ncbi:MAG: phage tail assembly chaperone [Streptomyces sp.]|nr:phage tail assembly chaperone [Streptomyces sp.]
MHRAGWIRAALPRAPGREGREAHLGRHHLPPPYGRRRPRGPPPSRRTGQLRRDLQRRADEGSGGPGKRRRPEGQRGRSGDDDGFPWSQLYYLAVGALHIPPDAFWDMTFGQLMTLADEHQAAHQTGGTRPQQQPAMQSGPGLLDMARMTRG